MIRMKEHNYLNVHVILPFLSNYTYNYAKVYIYVCNVGSQNQRREAPQKLMVKLNKCWMGG